ncbi:L-serine ammonia-lyase [Denitrobaculum tricleocarpae]|uniref:L-serine dehydratase n=1 Tax=Denitrobaculum tricleocarpae TaxID=2591009 RepID=A0A545TQN8_9PROT|nr:L-serine ammonia-lyase [Denitrobaculum tricleocarpae]TQV79534.1 L-serine ammonia-lyase [Denitrobaculum tricleocarpae]
MFISVFDVFKIGIGPSSSHTMGPMVAASRFLNELRERSEKKVTRVRASLYGSLAFTGKGHATDRAVYLGLMGFTPDTLDADLAKQSEADLRRDKCIAPAGLPVFIFDPETDLIYNYGPPLEGHANGLKFVALDKEGETLLERIYYSIGGGFVVEEAELEAINQGYESAEAPCSAPYPFATANEMMEMGARSRLSLAEMKRANELQHMEAAELDRRLDQIWDIMNDCIERGLKFEGELPGGLKVKRRAADLRRQLENERESNSAHFESANEWLAVYAMAVNEENAAGGQVVTAPTNGAAGVIPAVLRFYLDFYPGVDREDIRTFLLTASGIGGIIKKNASISGAEVGCQGEVGSAAAMAAAGLCAVRGGTNEQIENAAEIAMEHHLGMTCDPVNGLVQVPCIERNGLGAVKAVTAAALALRGDGKHFMPLDNCIEAMRQTGIDMSTKYKETSTGGLSVNLPEC